MKKFLPIFFLIFFLTACNNNGVQNISHQTTEHNFSNSAIIGTFSTKLTDKTTERLNNIELGISALNNSTIKPGETFSFNETIGPRTSEKGYREAIIFDGHGNKEKGLGGGICQISSTLYNAALSADLEIVERHQHSRNVPYIEEGKDATVSYGADDLKIYNQLSHSVRILAAIENDKIIIKIEK